MKVIMLKGPGSCGKTTTLNLVYDKIYTSEGVISPKKSLGGNKKDFEALQNYNGEKVAFFTMGDYSYAVIEAISKYSAIADVLIIACNDRFVKPFNAIKNYTLRHLVIKNKQNDISQQAKNDNAVANEIILKI